ncbi:ATP-binding protein [Sphingomonas paeninsulae]|uniref:ATP-binding protein n=1 Tax=Sphingomonas paeninsulae TaxID=2319844 RepID=UPI001EEF9580|nr:ATP-binding protein [Sphingomonas paeninsulae]
MLGRLFLILLLTVLVEFSASTLLYERASQLSLREDEAHRLAEHLVVSRALLDKWPQEQRKRIARDLVTDRYGIGWSIAQPSSSSFRPHLDEMQRQILAWEPQLARSSLHLRLPALQNGSTVLGDLRLSDGSWMTFEMRGLTSQGNLAVSRILRALIPALILLLFSGLLIRSTLRPLRTLIGATSKVGLGKREPIEEAGSAEIRSLIHAFNEMQDRIHKLIESRTLALAAVSHDLRTPLARLQLRIEAVRETGLREELGSDVAEMDDMVASLLAFFGRQSDAEKPALADLAVTVLTLVNNAADRGLNAHYIGPDHLEITLHVSAIRRAISNLLENALHYGGRAEVRLESSDSEITITVDDDGPGIPEDRIAEVQQPFVRLADARERNTSGLGLGLAIVASVVEAEGGVFTLTNRSSGGLSARIKIDRP